MKKICIKPQCKKEYGSEEEGFDFENCMVCGAPLELVDNSEEKINREIEENINYTVKMDKSYVEMVRDNLNSIDDKMIEIKKGDKVFDENLNEFSGESMEETALIDNSEIIEKLDEDRKEGEIFEIDKQGYIYFFNSTDQNLNVPKVQIYEEDIVYNTIQLKYDEMFVGRAAMNIVPDIDFSELDKGKIVSRKHGVLYKKSDGFYIKNIASKNSIEINGKVLPKGEERKINDGDDIVFSRKYLMKYVL